jgi:hypothetical protein
LRWLHVHISSLILALSIKIYPCKMNNSNLQKVLGMFKLIFNPINHASFEGGLTGKAKSFAIGIKTIREKGKKKQV